METYWTWTEKAWINALSDNNEKNTTHSITYLVFFYFYIKEYIMKTIMMRKVQIEHVMFVLKQPSNYKKIYLKSDSKTFIM